MAAAFAGHGGIAAAAGQTVPAPFPASVDAGNGLILTRAAKPDTAVFTTPAGWTLLDDRAGGSGIFGNDTGPVRLARYFREATGPLSGTVLCDSAAGTVDVQQAIITRYTRSAGAVWSVAASGAVDAVPSVDWSVAAAADPGVTTGDLIEVALAWPTDAARSWLTEGLTVPGAAIGAVAVPAATGGTSLGADMATRLHCFQCTSGTSTGAPVYAATVNSGSNVAGPTSIVRLREVPTGPATVALTPASLPLTVAPVDPVPGRVAIALAPADLALTVSGVEPRPGRVTVVLAPAELATAVRPVAALPGPVIVGLTSADMDLAPGLLMPVESGVTGRGTARIRTGSAVRVVSVSEVRIL